MLRVRSSTEEHQTYHIYVAEDEDKDSAPNATNSTCSIVVVVDDDKGPGVTWRTFRLPHELSMNNINLALIGDKQQNHQRLLLITDELCANEQSSVLSIKMSTIDMLYSDNDAHDVSIGHCYKHQISTAHGRVPLFTAEQMCYFSFVTQLNDLHAISYLDG